MSRALHRGVAVVARGASQRPVLGLCALVLAGSAWAAPAPHRDDQVYRAVEAQRPATLALLKDLVNVDSGTGDVDGGTRIGKLLLQRLRALGAEVHSVPAEAPDLPPSVLATFTGSGRARILVIAHFDTVFGPGTAAARPFRMDTSRAYGPGVGDEKGGVVCAFAALAALEQLKFHDFAKITFLIDNSEERGSPGSMNLIKNLAREHDVEFNMEPGDPPDAITVWRKGSSSIEIAVEGRAAHAGMAPQDGRNAALELVHQLDALDGAFPTAGDGITVNLTLLNAGSRNNIIPDHAQATLNVRFRSPEQFEQVLARVEADAKTTRIADTRVSVSHGVAFPPLTENAAIDALAARAQGIYAELGRSLAKSGNGGASESAVAMAEGTPALDGLGFVGGDFHTDHEWVDLASVTPRVYLFARLLQETAKHPPTPTR